MPWRRNCEVRMDSKRILSLLGLALRGDNLAVGEEPVEAAARARDARLLLLASNAAENTRRRAEHFALAGQCLWLTVPFTKEELGRALGRTSVALAAVTDTGLAGAVARRLAEDDPALYGETAARLEVKVHRARERRAEHLAHEKNVRRGKKRRPAKPPERAPERAAAERRPARGTGSRSAASSRPGPGAPSRARRPVKKSRGSFRGREG